MNFKTLILATALALAPSAARAEVTDADFQKAMGSYLAKDENVEKVGEALERFFVKKQEEKQRKASEDESKAMDAQFKNPVKIDIGTSPVRGKESAPILIVEFSDFQCPFCQRATAVVDQLLEKYPNDVKVTFKHLPLPFHPEAKPSAKATIAAQRQGKFWEMHDLLFKNQDQLNEANYLKWAGELGLDMAKFKADMASKETEAQIEADGKIAEEHKVQGTPNFFVNGVQVRGARPAQHFEKIIERWKSEKK